MTSIALIIACLLASAFFSGSETALMRLRRSQIEAELEDEPGPAAFAIRDLLHSTSPLLVTILFGNNVVNILGAAAASALAVAYLGPDLGVAVATAVMTLLVLVFCEVLPKAVAAAHPRGISRLVALPLYLLHQLLRPMHRLFASLVDPLVKRVGVPAAEGESVTAEEIVALAREVHLDRPGGGAPSIISAAARATETTAREIMCDRTEIVAFPIDTPAAALLEAMLDERYTRAPLYEGSIDRVLGKVHLKDLARFVREGGTDVREILRPVLRVPERKPILALLAEMQHTFLHLAIVKDEHGVTQGLVTLEDVLEELVGEIRDEHDREELESIRRLQPDSYEALGRVKVIDFNRQTGWEVPAERGDTLSGLVFNQLGRAPRQGDHIQRAGYELRVSEVSGNRIVSVVVRRCEPPAAESPAQ